MSEKFTFFWSGPFSQWYPSPFSLDGTPYGCAEQYMMAEKARIFGDVLRRKLILKNSDPAVQKRLGRKVEGFNQNIWEANARNIVFRGNLAKFSQNPDLLKDLLATAGTTLVEASPKDTIWGIGLTEGDPRAQRRSSWRGTNWLGETLTKVRDVLLEKQRG